MCVCACVVACVLRSEDLLISFHSVGSGDQSMFFRYGGKFLYPLNYLTEQFVYFFTIRSLKDS